MAGLFFCLASAEGAGLLFFPCCNMPKYKRLQRVLYCLCSYITHSTKQRTGLYSGFSCDCARSSAHDTRLTQAAIIPPAPRWSVSQRRSASSAYQIPPSRPDAAQVSTAADHASPAMSAPTACESLASAAPCAPADVSASPPVQGQPVYGLDTSHARRLAIWPGSAAMAHRVSLASSTRRGSLVAWARRAARNH